MDKFKEVLDIGYKLIFLFGILPVFLYLLTVAKFYPSGLALGDAFFFFLVALVFGFCYALFIALGMAVASVFWSAIKSFLDSLSNAKKFSLSAVSIVIIFSVGFFIYISVERLVLIKAIIGFFVSGSCLLTLINSLDNSSAAATTTLPLPSPKPKTLLPWSKRILWMGVVLAPVLLSSEFLVILNKDYVMKKVGLHDEKVTLRLDEENYKIMTAAVGGRYAAALGCETGSSGSSDGLVHGVTVLWHGMGERSLVEIPSSEKLGKSGEIGPVRVELKREGVFILKNYKGAVERCLDLNSELLFKEGTADFSQSTKDYDELLKAISKVYRFVKEIEVIGHADAMAHPGGAEKNSQLALERAQAIAKKLTLKFPNIEVTAVGHGAREPKTLCKDWPVKATLAECLAINRRVEVRMEFFPEGGAAAGDKSSPGDEPAVLPLMLDDNGRLYLYTSRGKAGTDQGATAAMNEWLVYSTCDMKNWTAHETAVHSDVFQWASGWTDAANFVKRDGRYWFLANVIDRGTGARSLGMAVADSPLGPFADALGKPLTPDQTEGKISLAPAAKVAAKPAPPCP